MTNVGFNNAAAPMTSPARTMLTLAFRPLSRRNETATRINIPPQSSGCAVQ